MPYDANGRWYDDAAAPPAQGAAPPTRYEEGGAAGGLPPVRPFPGMEAFGKPAAAAAGARTVFEDAIDASERLMGFLVITDTKEEEEWRYFRLRRGVNFLGRFGSRSQIELRDREVSEKHLLVVCTNSAARAIDLDSSNGTLINGERREIAQLADGDRIRVGRTTLLYVGFPFVAED